MLRSRDFCIPLVYTWDLGKLGYIGKTYLPYLGGYFVVIVQGVFGC